MTTALTTDHGQLLHRPSGSGLAFWGPGDFYRFLITGAESGGAYFAMEAIVPPGGGPPPHIHRNEKETFYVLEGEVEFLLGDRLVKGRRATSSTSRAAPCTASTTPARRAPA
jgi:quercetin dioxygenase-like cupin family protein